MRKNRNEVDGEEKKQKREHDRAVIAKQQPIPEIKRGEQTEAPTVVRFTVDVKECRMSDGCSAIGHATGVRAIVRGCDRANAQGAGKSVILPDGNALSLGRGGRFVMPDADGGGHGSRGPP